MDFAEYQHRLEKQHGEPIEQIMRTVYIDQDYGPATAHKNLEFHGKCLCISFMNSI